MGQVRHGSATTTYAVRAAIQRSQASLATLSRELGINPKTVAKWRKRQTVDDLKTGPKEPRSTVLTEAQEAAIVAFRRHTLLPLDDCLYALQPSIPHLTRSALHRCLQRHGISRLPDVEGDKPKRSKFKRYAIGFFHIDIAEVQTAEGKLFLFVGIDRTSKFAVTQLVEKADRKTAWEFLQYMLEAVPYRVHTILTDNGIQFAEQPRNRNTAYSRPMRFDMICEANGIEHRLTKPNHPWTNGQVERMNRTIKEATVKRFHYDSHDQLRTHLSDFVAAYNFARRLKTISGLTPYEYICKIWTAEPDQFILDPIHQMPGLRAGRFAAHCQLFSDLRVDIEEFRLRLGAHGIEVATDEGAERGCEGDVGDIDIREAGRPEPMDVLLGDARGVPADLHGIVEHGDLLIAETCIPVIAGHGKRLPPAQSLGQQAEIDVRAVARRHEPGRDEGDEAEVQQAQREPVPDLMQQLLDRQEDVRPGGPAPGRLHDHSHGCHFGGVERRDIAGRLVRFDCMYEHGGQHPI